MIRYNLLLLTTCYLLLALFACGRRGDPIPIVPIKEPVTTGAQERDNLPSPDIKNEGVLEEKGIIIPPSPTGLVALWTGKAIVLTWDEIIDNGIKGYNIYRSSDSDFKLIGKTITPAFTDRDVMPGKRYLYRVTAIAAEEGLPSKEIEIMTEP